ncbi:MAG: sulfite exporter TauE/SafE family protein [Actinobacteria bacterium]|nr:sulfite exporter TauE/SafE family protein [Actinomycetota bacterium]MCG2808344.1 sulfite exporter TauE/SafE family protein [Coriobacteriia bacterium]
MDLFLPMLALGLVTSLHCVSMCGPMVVGYALKGTEGKSLAHKVVPNLAYQGAKITSYILVGLLLGTIGSAFNLDAVRPYVMFVAGAFMVIIALGMTGRFPWAARMTPAPPKFLITALSRTRRKANEDAKEGHSSLATPVTLGLLTGLFPCAPLMSAQLTAAASGSALNGALVMFAFGLGTAPLMLGFGTASSLLPARLKERVMLLLAVVVLVFGLVYINRGAMLVGSPVTAASIKQSILGGSTQAPTQEYTRGADGVAEIPLSIVNTQFQPQSINIPADEAVRLIVDRQEDNACSDQLAVPQMGVLVDLAPFDTTVVELPATKAGTYTLTCGMGMMSGSITVGAGGGSSSSLLPLVLLVVGVGAGSVWYLRTKSAPKPAPGKKAAAAAAAGPTHVLGMKPEELLIIGGVVGFAVFAGLFLGGFFGN